MDAGGNQARRGRAASVASLCRLRPAKHGLASPRTCRNARWSWLSGPRRNTSSGAAMRLANRPTRRSKSPVRFSHSISGFDGRRPGSALGRFAAISSATGHSLLSPYTRARGVYQLRGRPMSIDRYRQYAADCVRQAQSEDTPEDRTIMLNVALAWLRLAQQTEDAHRQPADGAGDRAARSEFARTDPLPGIDLLGVQRTAAIEFGSSSRAVPRRSAADGGLRHNLRAPYQLASGREHSR